MNTNGVCVWEIFFFKFQMYWNSTKWNTHCKINNIMIFFFYSLKIYSILFPPTVSKKKCHNASSAEWPPTIFTRRLINYQTSLILFLLCWVRNLIRMSKIVRIMIIPLPELPPFQEVYKLTANGSNIANWVRACTYVWGVRLAYLRLLLPFVSHCFVCRRSRKQPFRSKASTLN